MDLQTLQFNMAGIDIPAFFAGAGQADLKFALHQISGLPDQLGVELFRQYMQRRALPNHLARVEAQRAAGANSQARYIADADAAPTKAENRKLAAANKWLSDRANSLAASTRSWPVPVSELRHEDARRAVAREQANESARIMASLSDGDDLRVDPMEFYAELAALPSQWGFAYPAPEFADRESMESWIVSHVARYLDEEWWERKINRAWDRYTEHVAIMLGKTRVGVSAYLSHSNLQIYKHRKSAAAAWLRNMLVVNEQYGLELPLIDAVNASVSNPKIRRHELMVRMRGFENAAIEAGHIGLFITWTVPSRFHAWKQRKKDGRIKAVENKAYDPTLTPRDGQRHLCGQWAKCRAALARKGLSIYGFRVCEPHHDGTPHWHMLVFCAPEHWPAVISTMQTYAIGVDGDKPEVRELERRTSADGTACPLYTDITPRFDWKHIDAEKGSATGYIAKYIAKNLDGFKVGDDHETGQAADQSVNAVTGWSSWWGIRQFQQIGGPSVTVWRELRRAKEVLGPAQDIVLEACRHAADKCNWLQFCYAMGGVICPRKHRPTKLLKDLIADASRYGEDVERIKGVEGIISQIETRLEGWAITKHGLAERQIVAARQGGAPDLDLPGRGATPWSSDNNCTDGSARAEKGSVRRELADHAAHLGLSDEGMARVLSGGIVHIDDRYIWYRGGQLVVSDHHMTATVPDDPAEADMMAERQAEIRAGVVAMRRSIWQVIDSGADIGGWLASRPDDEMELATEQMADIISQLEQEQYIARMVEQRGSRYAL